MPYINQELRDKLDDAVIKLIAAIELHTDEKRIDGAANYVITKMIRRLYTDGPPDANGVFPTNYYRLNRVRGLIGCIEDDFVNRLLLPYEKQKEFENGDVW